MNGRTAKQQRRDGMRRRKLHRAVPVDDDTNYAFDKQLYWDRRNHTITAPVDHVGHEIVGYVVVKADSAAMHNPADIYPTFADAMGKLPNRKKHGMEVRAVIKKPLRGFLTAPTIYETVDDEQGNPVRIPRGHKAGA